MAHADSIPKKVGSNLTHNCQMYFEKFWNLHVGSWIRSLEQDQWFGISRCCRLLTAPVMPIDCPASKQISLCFWSFLLLMLMKMISTVLIHPPHLVGAVCWAIARAMLCQSWESTFSLCFLDQWGWNWFYRFWRLICIAAQYICKSSTFLGWPWLVLLQPLAEVFDNRLQHHVQGIVESLDWFALKALALQDQFPEEFDTQVMRSFSRIAIEKYDANNATCGMFDCFLGRVIWCVSGARAIAGVSMVAQLLHKYGKILFLHYMSFLNVFARLFLLYGCLVWCGQTNLGQIGLIIWEAV